LAAGSDRIQWTSKTWSPQCNSYRHWSMEPCDIRYNAKLLVSYPDNASSNDLIT
jgi:hypothetical protein